MANEDSNDPLRQNTNMFSCTTNDEQDSRGADSIEQAAERHRMRAFNEGLSNENVSSLHRPILEGPECESAYWRQEPLPESATAASPFGSVTQSVSSSLWLPQVQSRTNGQQFSPSFQLQRPDQLISQRASVYSSSLPQYQTRSLADVSSPFGSHYLYHPGQPSSAAPGESSWDSSPWLKMSPSPPHHLRPGAPHNVPFVPPRLQGNYSSIPAKSAQGVLRPPVNLSRGHQPMSEAQSVNDALLRTAMSDLQLAFNRIMVLESENNSLKTSVHSLTKAISLSDDQIAKLKRRMREARLDVVYLCQRIKKVEDQVGLLESSSKGQLSQGMETGCSADQNENLVRMECEDQLPTREHPSPSSPGRRPGTEPLQETRDHSSPPSPGRRPDTEPLQETREHPSPTSSGRRPDEEPVQENVQRSDQDEEESATSSSAIDASARFYCSYSFERQSTYNFLNSYRLSKILRR